MKTCSSPNFRCPILCSPYLLHLRPRSWPTVAGHALAGSMMARGTLGLADGELWRALGAALVWAVCLNGGTLAFNSAHDQDDSDVGFLNNPPPPPAHLGLFGFGLMLVGAVAALFFGLAFFLTYLVCVILSWLYSAPPARLKTRGGWDVLINMIGYGALTALAGWLAVAPSPKGTDWFLFAGFAFLFATVYPMTQFYQREADRKSGARTLVLLLGDYGAMLFVHAALVLGQAGFLFAALGRRGDPLQALSMAGWAFLVVQAVFWFLFSLDWWIRFHRYPHQKGLYRAMILWGVSNVSLVVAFGFSGA